MHARAHTHTEFFISSCIDAVSSGRSLLVDSNFQKFHYSQLARVLKSCISHLPRMEGTAAALPGKCATDSRCLSQSHPIRPVSTVLL